jgi:hypothetical protein
MPRGRSITGHRWMAWACATTVMSGAPTVPPDTVPPPLTSCIARAARP